MATMLTRITTYQWLATHHEFEQNVAKILVLGGLRQVDTQDGAILDVVARAGGGGGRTILLPLLVIVQQLLQAGVLLAAAN